MLPDWVMKLPTTFLRPELDRPVGDVLTVSLNHEGTFPIFPASAAMCRHATHSALIQ